MEWPDDDYSPVLTRMALRIFRSDRFSTWSR